MLANHREHIYIFSSSWNRKLQDVAEDLCAMAATLRQCADTDPDTIVVAHAAVALDVVEQIKIDFLQNTA